MYDHTNIYHSQIEEYVQKISTICAAYGIPCLMSFAVANNNSRTQYKNTIVHASANVQCLDDRISTMLMALNGCREKPPKEVESSMRYLENYLTRIQAANADIRKNTQSLAGDSAPRIPTLSHGDVLQYMVNIAIAHTQQEVPYEVLGTEDDFDGDALLDEDIIEDAVVNSEGGTTDTEEGKLPPPEILTDDDDFLRCLMTEEGEDDVWAE